jgi:hypothetical protein
VTVPEPALSPEDLEPVTVTEVDGDGPEAPGEVERHGEATED